MRLIVLPFAALVALSACSSGADQTSAEATAQATGVEEPTAGAAPASSEADAGAAPTPMALPVGSANIIGLEGLGDLKIGQAVPQGSSWAERGAQIPGGCKTVSSPDYPGAYAIVEGGKVRRITIGKSADVKLVEGIGVGSTEAEVKQAFPGFRAEPHKYEEAPAKYLTAPGAEKGGPALRFEIGRDGKVSMIHVGTMPVLGYVEGCA